MCDTLKGLEGQLESAARGKGPYRGIPVQLHPKLIEMEPYWSGPDGGNDLLRALGDIANPNKHRVPIRGGFDSREITIARFDGFASFQRLYDWNAAKDELTVARFKRIPTEPYSYKVGVHVIYTFADGGVLSDKPLARAFGEMLTIVEGVVGGLEAETLKILG